MNKLIGFILLFAHYATAQQLDRQNCKVDLDSIRIELEKNLRDTTLILKTDSTGFTLIAGMKVYNKKIIRNSKRVNEISQLILDDNCMECIVRNHVYCLDFLFTQGLDLGYNYYSLFRNIKNTNSQKQHWKSKEYKSKKKILDVYFGIYDGYKIYLNTREVDDAVIPYQNINQELKYLNTEYRLYISNILQLEPPLDKHLYRSYMEQFADIPYNDEVQIQLFAPSKK